MLALPLPVGLAGAVAVDQRAGPNEPSAHDSVAIDLAVRGRAAGRRGVGWGSRHDQAGEEGACGGSHMQNPSTASTLSNAIFMSSRSTMFETYQVSAIAVNGADDPPCGPATGSIGGRSPTDFCTSWRR